MQSAKCKVQSAGRIGILLLAGLLALLTCGCEALRASKVNRPASVEDVDKRQGPKERSDNN